MNVGELKQQLDHYPDEHRVIFMPADFCGMGYPEFLSVDVATAKGHDYLITDSTDTVIVYLKDEAD